MTPQSLRSGPGDPDSCGDRRWLVEIGDDLAAPPAQGVGVRAAAGNHLVWCGQCGANSLVMTKGGSVAVTADLGTVLFSRENAAVATDLAGLRQDLRSAASEWGLDRLQMDTLLLVVTELVSNAIQHARSRSVVVISRHGGAYHVVVTDHSTTPPASDGLDAVASHKNGLRIVAALARAWGWDGHKTGKTVWADVHLAEFRDLS